MAKKKDIVQIAILAIICGLITWHVVHWHATGVFAAMLEWTETGKAYLTALYNLVLMVSMGTAFGLLMLKIIALIHL